MGPIVQATQRDIREWRVLPSNRAGRPDVVLVLIDTFRPDHLASFGYERATAPFLDSLLRRSTVFSRAFSSSSWTAPSTSSLFTSLYPSHHGVTEGFRAHQQRSEALEELEHERIVLNRLPSDRMTLPEILQAAGYTTLGVSSNINIGKEIGFDRGFNHFEKLRSRAAPDLGDRIRSWYETTENDGPRFVCMHFNDVHEPYRRREPWYQDEGPPLVRTVSAYDSGISFLDRELEALYRDLSWDRETLMVVVSDHGEEFMEHGRIGHHFTLYNELMRVLVAFSSSALEIPSQLRERPNVSLVDVAPTILDLIGVPIPRPSDGRSMSSLVLATESSPTEVKDDRVLFGHRSYHRVRAGLPERHLWAAVQGPWKFIDSDLGESLFHLEDDPRERVNRIAEEPEIANRLRHRLRRLQAEGFRSGESTKVEIDEETRRRLEALGYVQ